MVVATGRLTAMGRGCFLFDTGDLGRIFKTSARFHGKKDKDFPVKAMAWDLLRFAQGNGLEHDLRKWRRSHCRIYVEWCMQARSARADSGPRCFRPVIGIRDINFNVVEYAVR